VQLGTDKIVAEKEGAIGWLTFNNPARRNAMSYEMWEAVSAVVDDFAADPAIRVVVMKGAGDQAFVSGGDISQFAEKRSNAETAAIYGGAANGARKRLSDLEKPLIAMIRGCCLGGGLGVALTADLRIASRDSQFGIPAARLSIAYGFDGVRTLVSLVGPGVAKQILYTARRYPAETALRMGLIEEVTAPEDLEQTVRGYAETMAANAPLSIRATKLTVAQILKDADDRDMDLLARIGREALDSEDYKEGRQAFMEKRKPVFVGR
jgi:enoyl-CoA hydratase